MTDTEPTGPAHSSASPSTLFSTERTKAFIDAVVAIAMTLLILPLMESVAEFTDAEGGTAAWLKLHDSQLFSFLVSFVLIALFWMNHHRQFAAVQSISGALMWLSAGWMLTIVWLPVATAVTGRMPAEDAVAKAMYFGTMILTCLFSLAIRLYLRAHPDMHTTDPDTLARGFAIDVAMTLLFAVSLAVALLFPSVGYMALFLMALTSVVQRPLAHLFRSR